MKHSVTSHIMIKNQKLRRMVRKYAILKHREWNKLPLHHNAKITFLMLIKIFMSLHCFGTAIIYQFCNY